MSYNSPIMEISPGITLRIFRPEDQQQVQSLILNGLAQHWGTLDPTKNPDLENIAKSYAGAVFLVAEHNSKIVGTGALIPHFHRRGRPPCLPSCSGNQDDDTAEIVRMSVARGMRRQGLGSQILQELCLRARKLGFRRIVLETTAAWQEVIAFYQRSGFVITHSRDGDVYFELTLSDGEDSPLVPG